MGGYFCLPNERNETKTIEAEGYIAEFELIFPFRSHQRLYTVKEDLHEASESSEIKH